MLKKTIAYTDFDGVERVEDFYFNLTNSELIKIGNVIPDGLSAISEESIKKADIETLFSLFQTFIISSYGIKSEDGKYFRKSEELSRDFEQSAAFDSLFNEFMDNPEEFNSFLLGIIPANLAKKINNKN